jgi:TonB family protein
MGYFSKHRRGTVGTIIFHVVLLVLLIFFGFTTPLPFPEEEGILINFGTDDSGSGLLDPGPASTPEESTPPPEPASSEPIPAVEAGEEEIVTQDMEESAAIPSGTKEEVKPTPEEIEAERKRREEAERLRQEQLERERQEALERQRQEEEQRRIQEIADRTKNAFAGGRSNSTESTSQGVTEGAGNQGGISGDPNATNTTGTGTGDDGISYSLAGRTPQSLPLPEYNYQVEGRVVVEVTVDRNGKVTQATPGVKGSTTLNEYLLNAARKAALAAKFDRKPDAPAFQKGTITYLFMLQ